MTSTVIDEAANATVTVTDTWSGGIPVDGQMFVTGTSFDGLGRVTGRSMSTTTAGTVARFVR